MAEQRPATAPNVVQPAPQPSPVPPQSGRAEEAAPLPLRALSLWQPHATLMAIGAKRIETRDWPTSYRGWIAIQATANTPSWALTAVGDEPFSTVLREGTGISFHSDADEMSNMWLAAKLPRGAIVSVGKLVHVGRSRISQGGGVWIEGHAERVSDLELEFGDFRSVGRYGWIFTDMRRLPEPIPCKGKQGLWVLPPDVEARVREVMQ